MDAVHHKRSFQTVSGEWRVASDDIERDRPRRRLETARTTREHILPNLLESGK